jgi:hypothetical protein
MVTAIISFDYLQWQPNGYVPCYMLTVGGVSTRQVSIFCEYLICIFVNDDNYNCEQDNIHFRAAYIRWKVAQSVINILCMYAWKQMKGEKQRRTIYKKSGKGYEIGQNSISKLNT